MIGFSSGQCSAQYSAQRQVQGRSAFYRYATPLCSGLVVLPLLCTMLFSCADRAVESSLPSIESLSRYGAAIAWTTERPLSQTLIWYADDGERRSYEDRGARTVHRVTLTGLQPGTRYTYYIRGNEEQQYSFRTPPVRETSFRFCVLYPDGFSKTVVEEMFPDFVLIAAADTGESVRLRTALADLNTSVPVYTCDAFRFQRGDYLFVDRAALDTLRGPVYDSTTVMTVSCDTGRPAISMAGGGSFENVVVFSTAADSTTDSSSPATVFSTGGRSLLVEVQGDGVSAGFLDRDNALELPLTVREGAVSYQKTCEYCRKLFESKQYRRSISNYRRFIEKNPDVKLHDDAWYQIGLIQDRYLFDYPAAVQAYETVTIQYPSSPLAHAASARLSYLRRHDDHAYQPLRILEEARSSRAGQGDSAMLRVAAILDSFPNTSLRSEALLWLGSTLANQGDEQAVQYFAQLAAEGSNSTDRWNGRSRMADLYYALGKYRQAKEIYLALREEYPRKATELQVRINRCVRNVRRRWMYTLAWILLVSIAAGVTAMPQPGIRGSSLRSAGMFAIVYVAVAAVPLFLFYEQLVSLVPFTLSLIASLYGGLVIITEAVRKATMRNARWPVRWSAGVGTAVAMTVSILYIVFYHFHYLFLFERLLRR